MKASFPVIILAGGFGQDLVAALQADITGLNRSQQATIQGLRKSLIHGTSGAWRASLALAPIHERKAVEYVLRTLEGVRRALPLASSVHIVVNAADAELFHGKGAGCLTALVGDLGLGAANIISNGARTPAEWKGDTADLTLALAQIGTSSPALVVSPALTFFPGYNMQRVVEHSLIRNKDTVGTRALTPADVALLGPEGHSVAAAADYIPVPPLASITQGSFAEAGSEVVEPLLVLQPSTLALIASAPGVAQAAPDLQSLAAWLLGQRVSLHGVDLGVGVVRLDTPACIDYADRLFNYLLTQLRQLKPSEPSPGDAELEEFGASMKGAASGAAKVRGGKEHVNAKSLVQRSEMRDEFVGDAAEDVAAQSLNRQYGPAMQDASRVARVVAEFDRLHFTGDRMATATATKHYVLPATFYMTQYRRQAADLMR